MRTVITLAILACLAATASAVCDYQQCSTATQYPNCKPFCVPDFCPTQAVGSACGTLTDNCGGSLSCTCPASTVCYNSACCAPGSCPTPATGSFCGTKSDGCGTNLNCLCPTGDVCYQQACCHPITCPTPATGSFCGTESDTCGGTLNCLCPTGDVCYNSACCAPVSCPTPAVGSYCGPKSNGCGTNLTCTCPTGTTCYNSACCQPKIQCAPGDCGDISNGCGGTLHCGPCCPTTCTSIVADNVGNTYNLTGSCSTTPLANTVPGDNCPTGCGICYISSFNPNLCNSTVNGAPCANGGCGCFSTPSGGTCNGGFNETITVPVSNGGGCQENVCNALAAKRGLSAACCPYNCSKKTVGRRLSSSAEQPVVNAPYLH